MSLWTRGFNLRHSPTMGKTPGLGYEGSLSLLKSHAASCVYAYSPGKVCRSHQLPKGPLTSATPDSWCY